MTKSDISNISYACSIETLKATMLVALEQCNGIVTDACRSADVLQSTHYTWVHDDSEYRSQVTDILNTALDFVESVLFVKIKQGDLNAIMFYLRTKGKDRGYSDGIQHKVSINEYDQMSEEDKLKLLDYHLTELELEKLKLKYGSTKRK